MGIKRLGLPSALGLAFIQHRGVEHQAQTDCGGELLYVQEAALFWFEGLVCYAHFNLHSGFGRKVDIKPKVCL